MQNNLHGARRQVAHLLVRVVPTEAERLHDEVLAEGRRGKEAGDLDGPLGQRLVAVDDHVDVRLQLETETRTGRARAVGRVEREKARLDLLNAVTTDGAGERAREEIKLARRQ